MAMPKDAFAVHIACHPCGDVIAVGMVGNWFVFTVGYSIQQ